MATSQPKKGRPRRPEGIKRLKLRESTYNLWIERKEALGVQGITNSEFAEMLLHQNLGIATDRDHNRSSDLVFPGTATGRYKSRTGSTRTASPGRINSDRLGSTRIMKKKNIKLKKTETFTHLKAKIPVNNGPN